ncbi:hypothetical protein ACQJBY_038937 [Aegilops geniculata]
MACKIALVVLSLSVLAFFLCLGTAEADPRCMYKVNPTIMVAARTLMTRIVELLVLDLRHQSTGVVCALLDNASAIHVNDHRTIPPLGEP